MSSGVGDPESEDALPGCAQSHSIVMSWIAVGQKNIGRRVKLFIAELEVATQQQTSLPPKQDTSSPAWPPSLGSGEHPCLEEIG